jgi:hypothetical protein
VTQQHTLRVACDLADLPEVIAAVERLGHRVECAAFDEWTRRRERDELLTLRSCRARPGAGAWRLRRKFIDSRAPCGPVGRISMNLPPGAPG